MDYGCRTQKCTYIFVNVLILQLTQMIEGTNLYRHCRWL